MRMALFRELCARGDLDGVRAAVARGEDVNAGDERNMTGLMVVLLCGHNSVVELLLQQPSLDINISDSYGDTALHYGCLRDNGTGLRMLLGDPRLTSVNRRSHAGNTPLMVAVIKGSVECVRELVRVEGVHLGTREGQSGDLESGIWSLEEGARWVKSTT